jgi:hypothetical protein
MFSFGSIRIDGVTYHHDIVIDHGKIRRSKKKLSRKFREEYGHTPFSIEERIPWRGVPPARDRHGSYGGPPGHRRSKERG